MAANQLNGKVAIVTGSSRGIGRAIAQRLGQDGASVVVNYSGSQQHAQEVVKSIESSGKAIAIQADMSQLADIHRLFEETIERFGKLDILVNTAGTGLSKPLLETTEEEFDRILALNTKGTSSAILPPTTTAPWI